MCLFNIRMIALQEGLVIYFDFQEGLKVDFLSIKSVYLGSAHTFFFLFNQAVSYIFVTVYTFYQVFKFGKKSLVVFF